MIEGAFCVLHRSQNLCVDTLGLPEGKAVTFSFGSVSSAVNLFGDVTGAVVLEMLSFYL